MDITPEYIKMCKKAEEIQKSHRQKIGDWQIDRDDIGDKPYLITSLSRLAEKESCFPHEIWLPRQDQLQEMFGDIALAMMSSFYYFWKTDNSYPFKTLEQFWLAFVMKEKYNKIWDGENWIRKEEVKDHREKPDPKIKPWDEGE